MGKPQPPAEREQEGKAVTVILLCIFVLVAFFIIGHFTYLYVIIISLILSILVYEW